MDMSLTMCHLYANLLNTYGDNGNLLVLKHRANARGIAFDIETISLDQPFDGDKYDMVFIGGGQDYEQLLVAKDLQTKKAALTAYIENNKVMLAICGGYQMLGQYYMDADGNRIDGISVMPHYTVNGDERFIGDVILHNKTFDEKYVGFENHGGRTYLGEGQQPLAMVEKGRGNNGEDGTEGTIYKNTFGSYLHGALLANNADLADRLLLNALQTKYPELAELPPLVSKFQAKAKAERLLGRDATDK
ncbi:MULTISPECIES: type 1 glutamine amidotransferase [Brochothrix]|uniref:Lipid II isoglutaminyl synthase (glutamine-hydrolyzing) subunit GatD n=2 Tax=Brochothrix thermosphacta TaxID=2756 RepID=A0A2X0RZ09_BROTH|nr:MULTISPECIES: adenosylcobyric acid synthase [Brochothrix]ODJ48977.1 adenosylcobyric acid synthase [Brochothrix thermosphacta DSM 20171 = FSL F6-1036]ANZ94380.1 adenosylcobyric acid synthase [Brochothrix thermosphacta]MBR5527236.1 glutamine amidotransferase [Brochothrix sp.]ODJ55602.1 adenosylcobyric acid synthase [Brochothrix thermosphacta]ODJ60481.1 adenosylcobyric acid synthase [Brochothrix thermosphacta]